MSATSWVQSITLKSPRLELRPLSVDDAAALCAICPIETFGYFVTLRPSEPTVEAWEEYVKARIDSPRTVSFTVVADGEVVGETAYMDIRDEAKGLEIGLTWYRPEVRGGWVNPLAKYLMLQHAFEKLGAIRVQLKTDGRNIHSQSAIKKLGAQYEGTLRRHGIQTDGYIRDTVLFSIIDSEWPFVKQNLEERLNQLDVRP